jgi:hypothetical protein
MPATISTLPHELLGEVFTEFASLLPNAPIVLGAVSRLFRHVAYTTPSVWSHLALSELDERRKTLLWLQLSKAHHVDVQIDLALGIARPEHGVKISAGNVPGAVEALQIHTDRVSSLCLRTETQAQARAALAAIYSDLNPSTRAVALRKLRICAAAPGANSLVALPAIPSIIDLETTHIPLGALSSLDLGNLQSLRLAQPLLSAPMAADDIIELVRCAPGLRRLHVEGRIADPTGRADSEECFMPQLAELHLRTNNVVALLDRFVVPALRTLYISDLDGKRAGASKETGEGLRRLLWRTESGVQINNKLRVLEIAGVEVERNDAVWTRCMRRMKLDVFKVDFPGEKRDLKQEDVAKVDACPQEPRTRPVEAAFSFGFGFSG